MPVFSLKVSKILVYKELTFDPGFSQNLFAYFLFLPFPRILSRRIYQRGQRRGGRIVTPEWRKKSANDHKGFGRPLRWRKKLIPGPANPSRHPQPRWSGKLKKLRPSERVLQARSLSNLDHVTENTTRLSP